MMLISVSACDMPEVKRVSCSRCSRPSSCSLAWPLPTPLGRGPFDAQSRSRVATSSFRQETQEPGLASRQREVAAAAICLQLRTRRSRVVVMLRYVRIQPCIRTYHTQLDSLTECRRLCWLYSGEQAACMLSPAHRQRGCPNRLTFRARRHAMPARFPNWNDGLSWLTVGVDPVLRVSASKETAALCLSFWQLACVPRVNSPVRFHVFWLSCWWLVSVPQVPCYLYHM